jgi:hypothetical protein
LEGSIHELIKVLSWNLLGGTEGNFETLIRITNVLAEIQMEHLLNMNLEHYYYTNLLCAVVLILIMQ